MYRPALDAEVVITAIEVAYQVLRSLGDSMRKAQSKSQCHSLSVHDDACCNDMVWQCVHTFELVV